LTGNEKINKVSAKRKTDFQNDDARPLFEKLRRLRLDISKKLGVPPYVVFHDKTLMEMAAHKPKSRAELLLINGVGERKAEQFGDVFLKAISQGKPRSSSKGKKK